MKVARQVRQCVIVKSVQEGKCEVLDKQFSFDTLDTRNVYLTVRNRITAVIFCDDIF